MHWFPFYSSDFIGATVGLSCLERSLYALMLPLYYEVGPFPTDPVRVYRVIGCESDEQKRAVDYLLGQFFVLREDGWYQPKAERVKAESAAFHEKAVERGKRSANARREKYGTAQPDNRKRFESVSKAFGKDHRKPVELTTTTTTTTSTTKPTTTAPPFLAPSVPETSQPVAEILRRAPRAAALAQPSDVQEQVWSDFLQTRKQLKAAVTQTAVDAIRREAGKARISLEDALRMCCARGWRGFKAEWVKSGPAGLQARQAANADAAYNLLFPGEVIEHETK